MNSPIMPWGKFKGEPLNEIESSYLVWCLEKADSLRPTLRAAIERELGTRFGTPPPPPSSSSSSSSPSWRKPCPDATLATDLVTAGWRVLAKRHHPDVGGDTQKMQLINDVVTWLKGQVPQ